MRISDWSSDVCSSDLLRNLNLRRLLELMDYQHHSDLLSCGRVGTNRAFIQIQRMPVATPRQRSNLRSDVKIIDRGHKSQFRSSVWPRYCERPRTVQRNGPCRSASYATCLTSTNLGLFVCVNR